MSISHDFFNNPHKHLDSLDSHSLQVLIKNLNRELPFCQEILHKFPHSQTALSLLEKKIIELLDPSLHPEAIHDFSLLKETIQYSHLRISLEKLQKLMDEPISDTEKKSLESHIKQISEDDPRLKILLKKIEHLFAFTAKNSLFLSPEIAKKLYEIAFSISHTLSKAASELSSESIEASKKNLLIPQILKDIDQGFLARALWPVMQNEIALKELFPFIPSQIYEWMSLCYHFDPDKANLEYMALSQTEDDARGLGWGYKAANLTMLTNHCAKASLECKTADVSVPAFLPISDFEMQHYVKDSYPDILKDWARFTDCFTEEEKSAFGPGTLTLNERSKEILVTIQNGIKTAFEEKNYDTPFLQEWLKKHRPEFVIVRSTGKEDSDTNSNAGGNASIAFVQPESEAITGAMSEVLLSYFGEKSILQRLAAGDASLFDRDIFLPVLIQKMVGEPIKTQIKDREEIPSSGVIFTISSADPSISELSVGPGNNEGIVSSSITTDRYLLGVDESVVKAIREKESRYIARMSEDGTYTCESIENTDTLLRKSPSLSFEIAQDIKRVADYFSKTVYGGKKPKPLDIEFSVMTPDGAKRPIIYLLQARPLVEVKKEKDPSYVDSSLLKETPQLSKACGKVLIDGGAYVRESKTSSLLVCDSIKEALDLFLKSTPHVQSQIKTVVISKTAPITSHEAVTLRARGIGIVVMEERTEFTKVKNWVKESYPFVIDMQRGTIVATSHLKETSELIKPGYICYPIPLEYSITPSKEMTMLYYMAEIEKVLSSSQNTSEAISKAQEIITEHLKKQSLEIDELIAKLKADKPFIPSHPQLELQSWKEALDILATGSKEEAQKAAAFLLERLKKLTLSSKLPALAKTRLELLIVLEEVKKLTEGPLEKAFEAPALSLQRLYPVRLIEACLFQNGDVLGGFSARRSLQAIHNQQEIVKETGAFIDEGDLGEKSLLKAPLIRVSKNLLSSHDREIWQGVVKLSDAADPEHLLSVCRGFMKLADLGILTQWVNTSLDPILNQAKITTLESLSNEKIKTLFFLIDNEFKEANSSLQRALNTKEKERVLSLQLSAWNNPSHVKKQTPKLIKAFQEMGFIENASHPSSLTNLYQSSCPLGKLALLQSSLEMVRAYDYIIKTVKASTEYPDSKTKACDVYQLLDQYRTMMISILDMAQSENLFTKAPGASNSIEESILSIKTYLERIFYGYKQPYEEAFEEGTISPGFVYLSAEVFDDELCEKLLLPSEKFNVSSATVGSGSDYNFSTTWPQTLEDYFTLFHQNMEACLSALRSKKNIPSDKTPLALQTQVNAILDKLYRSSITSISVEQGVASIKFNVPLRQHAATLELSYDLTNSPEIHTRLKMSLFGHNENSRWDLMAGAIGLASACSPSLKIEKPDICFGSSNGIIFEIENFDQTPKRQEALAHFLATLNSLTMSASSCQNYLKAVYTLKNSLNPEIPLTITDQEIEKGGFELVLQIAQNHLLSEEFDKAIALIDELERFISAHPTYRDIQNQMGFFEGDREKQLSKSLEKLKQDIQKSKEKGLHISPWQSFKHNLTNKGQAPQHFLQPATKDLKQDPLFVTEAVLEDPLNILYADKSLKENKEFMKKLMQTHPNLYRYVDRSLEKDEELICLYATSPEASFDKIPISTKTSESVALAFATHHGMSLEKIPEPLKSKPLIVEAALKENGMALEFAPSYTSDLKYVLLAIQNQGLSLKFVSKDLIDENLCHLALTQNKSAYPYILSDLQKDPYVAKECLLANILLARSLPMELKNSVDFVLDIIEHLDENLAALFFKELPRELKVLPAVIRAFLKKDGLLIKDIDPSIITPEMAVLAINQNVLAHKGIPEIFLENEAVVTALVKIDPHLFFKCSPATKKSQDLHRALSRSLSMMYQTEKQSL